jgi:hypothetical protein
MILAARPHLFDEQGQIVSPVHGSHPAGIEHVGHIIFGVGEYERRMADFIGFVGMQRFVGRRDVHRALCGFNGGFAACKTDKQIAAPL